MSLIKKTINSLLEQESSIKLPGNVLGVEVNDMYKNLDLSTREKIDKINNEKHKEEVLKDISDPELKALYEKLNAKTKAEVDKLPIRDKYVVLKKMMEDKKKGLKEKEERKEKEEPKNNEKNESIIINAPTELLDQEDQFEDEENEKLEKTHYHEKRGEKDEKVKNEDLQKKFNELIRQFYSSNPFVTSQSIVPELEVRFGTRGIKPLSRSDYDNVIKKLKSFGFENPDPSGIYSLRINCEYLDSHTGKFKLSDVRTEINGLHNIQLYCKNNNIKEIYTTNTSCIKFLKKKPVKNNKGDKIFPVNFDDFNFRVSYSNEEEIKHGVKNFIIDNWKKSKKTFRYLNRVTFTHKDYPFNVDISISKYGNKGINNFGYSSIIPVYNVDDSNVFSNPETYEIEIEIDNRKIGPATPFNSPDSILTALRKVIKFVLGGLQGTNYPVSYSEQKGILDEYMKIIWNEEYDSKKRIDNRNFIGPNSVTLQLKNVSPMNDNSNIINIRKDFVVTEKADGTRHLMYINNTGKIYFINTNMNVIFTGAKTENKDCFNCLLDGELISHDKNGNFINLYAAFDIYYYNKKDVRSLSFMIKDIKIDNLYNARYEILKLVTTSLKPTSVVTINTNTNTNTNTSSSKDKTITSILNKNKDNLVTSPIRVVSKDFYPYNNKQSIFSGCNEILTKVNENRFEYETDGLIFTHAYFGVGSDKVGEPGPKTKITWEYSFKWKPPQFNTIDFLITTLKGTSGDEIVKPIFEDGLNTEQVIQLSEYKIIELRCGFDERVNGYINPCQDIIDDKLPEYKNKHEDSRSNNYIPLRFYPTDPYDNNAGLCNIMLKYDESGVKQMFSEENEVFTDNTIVEFSYNFDRKNGWRWIPLRVRHDKTTEYRLGFKQYGNSYTVANNNWNSIHYPITEDMIRTGLNIPDILVSEDTYYNTPSGKFLTESMKNFHNLYVKKMLIKSVSKEGDKLVDFACGKAGDLPKWIAAKLSFVFGIDISQDNLENRLNGACARFLNNKKSNKNIPYALFVNGNSAYNIKNGSAMLNDKAIQITKAIFGIGSKDVEKLGKGVARQYGVCEDGFNISSCQFAIHYFFENPDTLQGFLRNVAECTKLNGYFIGTAYDGKLVFNLLNKVKTEESIQIMENGKKIWEVTKSYGSDQFEDNSSCIGYKIDVFQESINQTISEYLVNFDYLNRVFESYGFKIIDREEAKELGLPEGSGLFSELFVNMMEEIKINKNKAKDYGNAPSMSSFEKKISFLNRYFVYKKIREVNTEKVELEMSEFNEYDVSENIKETKKAVNVSKKENKELKPKIRKLSTKLLLLPSNEEAKDEKQMIVKELTNQSQNITETKKTKVKKINTSKKPLIIIDEED
jgi:mRNA (guanine-N7-)-methyltransferase